MPIPGEAGNSASSFQDPVIEGDKIAFIGNWPERVGIYLNDLETVH